MPYHNVCITSTLDIMKSENHGNNSNPESFYVNQYNRHPSNVENENENENENETTDTNVTVNVNVNDNVTNENNDDDNNDDEEENVLTVVSMEYDIMLGTMGHNDPTSPKFYSTWCRRLVPVDWNCTRCCNRNGNRNRNRKSCSSCRRIVCCNKSSQSLSAAASSSEQTQLEDLDLDLDDIPEKPSNEEFF